MSEQQVFFAGMKTVELLLTVLTMDVKIIVSEQVKETFGELFKQLGVEFKEFTGELPGNCVVITMKKQDVIIEVYRDYRIQHRQRATVFQFEKALNEIISKIGRRKEDKEAKQYLAVVPEKVKKELETLLTGEKRNERE